MEGGKQLAPFEVSVTQNTQPPITSRYSLFGSKPSNIGSHLTRRFNWCGESPTKPHLTTKPARFSVSLFYYGQHFKIQNDLNYDEQNVCSLSENIILLYDNHNLQRIEGLVTQEVYPASLIVFLEKSGRGSPFSRFF